MFCGCKLPKHPLLWIGRYHYQGLGQAEYGIRSGGGWILWSFGGIDIYRQQRRWEIHSEQWERTYHEALGYSVRLTFPNSVNFNYLHNIVKCEAHLPLTSSDVSATAIIVSKIPFHATPMTVPSSPSEDIKSGTH